MQQCGIGKCEEIPKEKIKLQRSKHFYSRTGATRLPAQGHRPEQRDSLIMGVSLAYVLTKLYNNT